MLSKHTWCMGIHASVSITGLQKMNKLEYSIRKQFQYRKRLKNKSHLRSTNIYTCEDLLPLCSEGKEGFVKSLSPITEHNSSNIRLARQDTQIIWKKIQNSTWSVHYCSSLAIHQGWIRKTIWYISKHNQEEINMHEVK